jgi:lipopolysaccharide transport system permease protein
MTTPALARPPRRTLVIGPTSARSLGQGIVDLARYSELLLALSVFRVRARYKQSVLGLGWAVLQPVALMVIYTLVFSLIASVPTGGRPYALFAYTALLPWTFFSSALTGATSSLVANSSYVTKVYFPREIVPITYIVAAFLDFLVASLVLGGLLAYYRVVPGLAALWALPIMVLATALVTGLGLAAAALQVRVRDVGVAMPLLLQVWMFASPVVYPPEAVPAWLRPVWALNPMVGIVDGFRRAVLDDTAPLAGPLLISTVVTLVVLAAGYTVFRRTQDTMADII